MIDLGIMASTPKRISSGVVSAQYVGTSFYDTAALSYSYTVVVDSLYDIIVLAPITENKIWSTPMDLGNVTFDSTVLTPKLYYGNVSSPSAIYTLTGVSPGSYTVVVTYLSECARAGLVYWKMQGALLTPHDTAATHSYSGTGASVSLDIPGNGIAFYTYTVGNHNVGISISGAGTDFNANFPTEKLTSAALGRTTIDGATRNAHQISASHSNSTQPMVLIAASFAPS